MSVNNNYQSGCGNGILIHPFFVPIVTAILLQFVLNLFYVFVPFGDLRLYVAEGNFVSKLTTVCYLLLFIAFIWVFFDFRKSGRLLDYFVFGVLLFYAFAREHELLRWVMNRKDVASNLKFLFSAKNTILAKVVFVIVFIVLVLILIYLVREYLVWVVKEFFCFGTIAWSFATFVACFFIGQFIDWFPQKLNRYAGIHFSADVQTKLEIIEECTEFFLPLIIAIIFVQYHFILKIKQPSNTQKSDL
jgi:hypothetical protein